VGEIRTLGVLGSAPKPRPKPWVRLPPALPGKPVERTERPHYLGFISGHPHLKAGARNLLLSKLEP
jgi:hypothetical protein